MGSRRIRPKKMISSHISKHELVDFLVGACSPVPPEEFQLLVYDSVAHAYRSPDPNAANGLHIGVPMLSSTAYIGEFHYEPCNTSLDCTSLVFFICLKILFLFC